MEVSWKGTSKSSILIQLKPSSNRGYLHSYGNLHILTHDTNPADSLWWTSDLAQILRKTRGKDQRALWMSWVVWCVFNSFSFCSNWENRKKKCCPHHSRDLFRDLPLILSVRWHLPSSSSRFPRRDESPRPLSRTSFSSARRRSSSARSPARPWVEDWTCSSSARTSSRLLVNCTCSCSERTPSAPLVHRGMLWTARTWL